MENPATRQTNALSRKARSSITSSVGPQVNGERAAKRVEGDGCDFALMAWTALRRATERVQQRGVWLPEFLLRYDVLHIWVAMRCALSYNERVKHESSTFAVGKEAGHD